MQEATEAVKEHRRKVWQLTEKVARLHTTANRIGDSSYWEDKNDCQAVEKCSPKPTSSPVNCSTR